MTPDKIKQMQADMARLGLYTGPLDGLWGPLSDKAWAALIGQQAIKVPSRLETQLRRDEGEVLSAYQDHLGFWTIGIGRLIDKRKGGGISQQESSMLLANDIAKVASGVSSALPWTDQLDEARRGVLLNMAFQMGLQGLLGFRNTLATIQSGNYKLAAQQMLQSLWAKQTPERAKRLSDQMADGQWR